MSLERVVLDTNVLVSSLLNSFGRPGRVLDLMLAGELSAAHDDRVLGEYREVLRRERFGFSARDVDGLLGFLETEGIKVNPPVLGAELPDPNDVPFLEVAHAAGAVLVTGNLRHYPAEERRNTKVLEPAAFLERWLAHIRDRQSEQGGESE
ncbi:MAG: putative toxin-antitoxin system toxin component, PIN family [Rubrobacter sp.]|nr:putative toxin-antitoxin system toxin component, PIN family [Rubrobacter sp.]